ncbi:MAG: hypothetical protein KC503_16295 [Myxococcales bacterium]|nr:hypothetical protein [Myxococcales bacterium]
MRTRTAVAMCLAWALLAATGCIQSQQADSRPAGNAAPLATIERLADSVAGGARIATTRIAAGRIGATGLGVGVASAESYHARAGATPRSFDALNAAQRLRVRFDAVGAAHLRSLSASAVFTISLRAARWGYGEALRAWRRVTSARAAGRRVRYERAGDGVTEWYDNSPRGLEHGFTLARPPSTRRGAEPLVIELALTGARASLAGDEVRLRDAAGRVLARYRALQVLDAANKRLSARLAVASGAIRLVIDDHTARYPLRVDPVLVTESYIEKGHGVVRFGEAIALSGDTAVIGSPGDDSKGTDAGAAYVFVRGASGWVEQAKLVASDGAAGDAFGITVAIDGDTVLVGAPRDDDKGSESGSVYVYVRSGAQWSLQQKIVDAAGQADDHFGSAVALDGDTALASIRPNVAGSTGPSSVSVLVRSGSSWSGQGRLVPTSGLTTSFFGGALDISGDTAVVGDTHLGVAFVFVRSGTSWSEQQKLAAGPGKFGASVAVDGDAMVGCSLTGDRACYVFRRSGTSWSEEGQLPPPTTADVDFGRAVDISGSRVIVGAPGAQTDPGEAYVFQRGASGWDSGTSLTGNGRSEFGRAVAIDGDRALAASSEDPTVAPYFGAVYAYAVNGAAWPQDGQLVPSADWSGEFGAALSASKGTLVVGAPSRVLNGERRGEAGVYVRQAAGTWSEQQVLVASDGADADRFGVAVAIDGDTAVVGADGDDDKGAEAGSLYVFTRASGSWSQQQKLVAADGAAGDKLGHVVAVSGDTLAVAAPADDDKGQDSGSVYVFTRASGTWSLQQKIVAADGAAGDGLGAALSLDRDTLAIGAPDDDDRGDGSGAVYVFQRSAGTWTLQQKIVPGDGTAGARFGLSVALEGDSVAAGFDDGTQSGVYVFARSAGSWSQQVKLLPEAGAASYAMGKTIAMSGNVLSAGERRYTTTSSASDFKLAPPILVRDAAGSWRQRLRLSFGSGPFLDDVVSSASAFTALAVADRTVFLGFGNTFYMPGLVYIFELTFEADGATCSDADSCFSGVCFQSACCHDACADLCHRCDAAPFSCTPFAQYAEDTMGSDQCTGDKTCNGKGDCLLKNGKTCVQPSDCASGFCVDGVCCESECKGNCESCALGGQGKCEPHPKGSDPDKDCLGTDADCGGTCDGAGACDFPGIGTRCGAKPCQACDGTGRCNTKPPDDDACGVIDCDQLDTTCRDYQDLDAERCAAFGQCKAANDPATCTKATDLPCGDGGAGGDGGASGDGATGAGDSGGCSCRVAARPDGSLAVLSLLALVALLRRRRRRGGLVAARR